VLCCQCSCSLSGFGGEAQLYLAQHRKSLLGQEVNEDREARKPHYAHSYGCFCKRKQDSCVRDFIVLSQVHHALPTVRCVMLLLPICYKMENPT